jgi:hypothetical protein
MSFYRAKVLSGVAAALVISAGFSVQAATPIKVIAFYSDKAATGKGYLGIDPAHINFAHESNGFFPRFAATNGFTYDSTMDWTKVGDSAFLSQYNVAMWLDDQPGTAAEMTGFRKWMGRGGALICFHVCAYWDNSMTAWPWYFDSLIGTGSFNNNTWLPTSATLHVEDTSLPVTKGLPATFTSPVNEFYSFTKDVSKNANIKVLCKIGAFPVGTQSVWTSCYYPIIWANTKWKCLYDNCGHNNMNYATNQGTSATWATSNATHTQLILNALRWLAAPSTAVATPRDNGLSSERAAMRIDVRGLGLTVTRTGISDFAISIVDLRGNRIAAGRGVNGVYADDNLRLGPGVYIVSSTSRTGDATRVLNILR